MRSAYACPLCGTANHACGQAYAGTPVEIPTEGRRTVGETQRYNVTVNGNPTTLKLTDEDAARYEGAELVDAKAKVPANKARTPRNKAADGAAGNG